MSTTQIKCAQVLVVPNEPVVTFRHEVEGCIHTAQQEQEKLLILNWLQIVVNL